MKSCYVAGVSGQIKNKDSCYTFTCCIILHVIIIQKKHKCGLIMLLSLNNIKYENPDSLSLPILKVVDTDQGINLEWL